MNYRMILKVIGKVILIEAGLLIFPMAVALIYGESSVFAFLITFGGALAVGSLLVFPIKPKKKDLFAKEGLVIVFLSWIVVSAIGALPFVISGEIPSYADALFETVSGFTTTGSSILSDVEALGKAALFWRSFTHWIGGMGVLVFLTAITSNTDKSINILRAEMPGPSVDKIVPRAKDTARILYLMYVGLTAVCVIMLLCGGLSPFESLVYSFGAAGTGGFGVKADSIAGCTPYVQWVLGVFMLLFGVNFNLYYLILAGKIKDMLKSRELHLYLGIVAVATAVICLDIGKSCANFGETLRLAFFQVSSIITTTGYATADFNLWPVLSKGVLLVLMFIGGCAGSTAGGFKVVRVGIILEKLKGEFRRVLHPHSAYVVKYDGKKVPEETLTGVLSYLGLYSVTIVVVFLLVCAEGSFDLETNISAVVSCFNNIGPAFGAAGPMSSFADYGVFAKIVLTFAMFLGRLEIYPLLLTLNPLTWAKK